MLFANKKTTFPALIVEETKHCTNYFLINNLDDVIDVCWSIFKINLDSGFYSYEKNQEIDLLNQELSLKYPWKFFPKAEDTYKFYIEIVDNLEKEIIPEILKEHFKKYPENIEKMSTIKYWKTKAYSIIQERSSYEYEKVRLEYFDKY